jgi:hypothetical protein
VFSLVQEKHSFKGQVAGCNAVKLEKVIENGVTTCIFGERGWFQGFYFIGWDVDLVGMVYGIKKKVLKVGS